MGKTLLSLVMIIKNESRSLQATLDSVRGVCDRFTIVDTGSTDGSIDILQKALSEGWSGEIIEAPFVDYATTRNFALDQAKGKSVFTLMLSGDETIVNGEALRAFCEENRDGSEGAYSMEIEFSHDSWYTVRLARDSAGWRYRGAVHEIMVSPEGFSAPIRVPKAKIFHDTSRRDAKSMTSTWQKHLEILRAEAQKNPEDSRTQFYLAQTLECLGMLSQARKAYKRRAAMKVGFDQETYEAKFRLARVMEALHIPWDQVHAAYLDAYRYRPSRAEPLYYLAKHYRETEDLAQAFIFGLAAMQTPYPTNEILFVQSDVYRWKAADVVACVAYYLGHFHAGYEAAKRAAQGNPTDPRMQKNLEFYLPKVEIVFVQKDAKRDP